MKFKVGDRVKFKSNTFNLDYPNDMIGKMFTITTIHAEGYAKGKAYSVKEPTDGFVIYEVDLVSKNNKPKVPTHVVIWEEDRDPAQLFTSEKEAKDFIKTLSDKSDVVKDSILLIEIKSCKKAKVNKKLIYSQHKI